MSKVLRNGLFVCVALTLLSSCKPFSKKEELSLSRYNLHFSSLARNWDEAIPLGNGMLGALVWQKDNKLRISLDRADLWDLRPTANQDRPEWKFSWVKEQWEKNTYQKVQELFDVPYDRDPGPSKIPAGALEFDVNTLGEIESVKLSIKDACCEVRWKNGASLTVFISAHSPVGWYRFDQITGSIVPEIIPPAYNLDGQPGEQDPVTGQDLRRLGYPRGTLVRENDAMSYSQDGWGGFHYQVSTRWSTSPSVLEGCWSISSEYPGWEQHDQAGINTGKAMKEGFMDHLARHRQQWQKYWSQSSISIPDSILARQWYLEMYKLKSASGCGAPPVSLQAIWTADNGKLPPWKGDFHNDLNTQLSYWPAYSSNHLDEAMGFIHWMEKNKEEFRNYTRQYYETSGINVPGVATMTGKPMGGWIQYSFGPTVSAWLGQHYYLQWRYSMDREFLEKKAYPWIREVAVHLEELSVAGADGFRKLPLSSSPEIFDNSREAWFPEMTNFDLALVRWTFEKAAELASELDRPEEAAKWKNIITQWSDFDIDPASGFTFAKGFLYEGSHRHFSHLMAFHPLGLIDWSKGEKDQEIIRSTIETLGKYGPDWWCGYSYAWLGNLKARAFDGNGAADALRTFATCFCLSNSFHVNGDQSGTGKSKLTYRPFTLEGNFAFAAGIQEMLIQSHTGIIHIFPAIPDDWKEVSFNNMRTEGAFLVSAKMENKEIIEIELLSDKGGELKIVNPFGHQDFKCSSTFKTKNNIIIIQTKQGEAITLTK